MLLSIQLPTFRSGLLPHYSLVVRKTATAILFEALVMNYQQTRRKTIEDFGCHQQCSQNLEPHQNWVS
jgi:hypothetical protein